MNQFHAPGLISPDDSESRYLPDDDASNRERQELFRKWETVGLTPDEQVRFDALTADRLPPTH